MLPIYVVSMKNSVERRESISSQLRFMGLDFCFFDAINGYEVPSSLQKDVDNSQATAIWGKPLTPGEIGCALSHIEIYKKMVKENIPRCIIIEDDARLHIHFRRIIENIISHNHSDIVFLHHGKAKNGHFLNPCQKGTTWLTI